jgi:hypothetical protein
MEYPFDPATRLNELVADISVRLRNACAHIPEAEFQQLVRDIAELRLRFEVREHDSHSGPHRAVHTRTESGEAAQDAP